MGNCLIRQEKMIIKVIKTDGEVLEYAPPMKVHQVLSQYADHAISDVLPVVRHLRHQADMVAGQIYYLFQLPVASPESVKSSKTSTVRIKLVVTKQELEVMLKKGGVSVTELVSQIEKNGSLIETSNDGGDDDDGRWKPRLESIPESN
ncbi:uncharacterized protein LOC112513557 [Cynara cardunculus var. scolymus]|uniref:uncharacterized protein LOC112513557 n=1 Tax=Cynara cardunculus var. scolymus TaxID=59895 RepID=UPI000D6243D5|nr:uncharacterized protein LOC112513557 [Cynara cardunculus var. scolymus]